MAHEPHLKRADAERTPAVSVEESPLRDDERPSAVARASNAVAVVEDDDVLREVICAVLRDVGLEPHTASSLRNARQLIDAVRPRAILLDLHLGEDDGTALLDEVAGEGVGVPIVVMSADVRTLRSTVRTRCVAVLEKPFELDRLVDTMLAAIA